MGKMTNSSKTDPRKQSKTKIKINEMNNRIRENIKKKKKDGGGKKPKDKKDQRKKKRKNSDCRIF